MQMIPVTLIAATGATGISPLFSLLTIVLIVAIVFSLIFLKLKQSLLGAYFLCGIVIANSGLLKEIGAQEQQALIEKFAELGIVLLMFTIGIHFSLRDLRNLWRSAFIGGGLQMLITSLIGTTAAYFFHLPFVECFVIGVVLSLSSTAVSQKSFQDLGQQHNPGARTAVGIALFQDLFVILLFIILPIIYGNDRSHVVADLFSVTIKGVIFLCGAALLGRFGINPLLHAVAKTRSRELFTLTVIGLCVSVAYAGGALNLSLALGAFAAGLVVSESIYNHRIHTDILPFKDLFLTLFFVSVGLMIDIKQVIDHWWLILTMTMLVFLIKGTIVFCLTRLLKLTLRPALWTAISLSSIGEFSLVLMQKADAIRSLPPLLKQTILISTVLGMAIIPSLMDIAPVFAKWLEKRGFFTNRKTLSTNLNLRYGMEQVNDHAIICGYGPMGKQLHQALLAINIPCLIVDLNSETVRSLKANGQAVLFADSTHPEAVALMKVECARLVAFTFPNSQATKISIPLMREQNPEICIFARANFSSEADELTAMGTTVIHDEKESGLAMINSVMSAHECALLINTKN
jgi:monovalent cation:H+ antiporter-2, CPA2 family